MQSVSPSADMPVEACLRAQAKLLDFSTAGSSIPTSCG